MFVLCGSRSAIALMCCNRSCYEVPCAALVWSSQCMHTGNMNSLHTREDEWSPEHTTQQCIVVKADNRIEQNAQRSCQWARHRRDRQRGDGHVPCAPPLLPRRQPPSLVPEIPVGSIDGARRLDAPRRRHQSLARPPDRGLLNLVLIGSTCTTHTLTIFAGEAEAVSRCGRLPPRVHAPLPTLLRALGRAL